VRIFCGRIYGAQRQSMTSVGDVTAEEGREKFLCTQPESSRRPFAYETRMVPQNHCKCTGPKGGLRWRRARFTRKSKRQKTISYTSCCLTRQAEFARPPCKSNFGIHFWPRVTLLKNGNKGYLAWIRGVCSVRNYFIRIKVNCSIIRSVIQITDIFLSFIRI
jgi:hypothetical protein